MNHKAIVQYIGFESKALVREYTFQVVEVSNPPREFTLTIPLRVFDSHRARYQDAATICLLRLQRELATHANHPPETHFRISDADLEDYDRAHTRKGVRR